MTVVWKLDQDLVFAAVTQRALFSVVSCMTRPTDGCDEELLPRSAPSKLPTPKKYKQGWLKLILV